MSQKEFTEKQAAILDENKIPQEFHRFFCTRAWDQGHAYGHGEILTILEDLVYGFDKYLEAYLERTQSS